MLIQSSCPNCGNSLESDSFKAEGNFYVEFSCLACARLWTPRTMHEIVEAALAGGDLGKAQRIQDELDEAIKREFKRVPLRLRGSN